MLLDIRIVGLWLAIAVLAVSAQSQSCESDIDCDNNLICVQDNEIEDIGMTCRCPKSYVLDVSGECKPYLTLNRLCELDSDCQGDERCTPNVISNDVYLSLCLLPSTVNNATCRNSAQCPIRQRCSPLQLSEDTFVGVCVCNVHTKFDEDRGQCVQQPCEDWCVSSNSGDTCRNDMCYRCWDDAGFFVCDQFLRPVDPPIIIIRRPSFFSVWMMSFFFITVTLLMFSCVWKCCVSKRRPQRQAAHPNQRPYSAETYVEQTAAASQQVDSITVKMPLDTPLNAASLQSAQHPYDQPPPYATANGNGVRHS